MSKRTEQEFWVGLASSLIKQNERRPEGDGWKDLEWLTKTWDVCLKRAGRIASRLSRQGKLERFYGCIRKPGNRKMTPKVWYRPKNQGSSFRRQEPKR